MYYSAAIRQHILQNTQPLCRRSQRTACCSTLTILEINSWRNFLFKVRKLALFFEFVTWTIETAHMGIPKNLQILGPVISTRNWSGSKDRILERASNQNAAFLKASNQNAAFFKCSILICGPFKSPVIGLEHGHGLERWMSHDIESNLWVVVGRRRFIWLVTGTHRVQRFRNRERGTFNHWGRDKVRFRVKNDRIVVRRKARIARNFGGDGKCGRALVSRFPTARQWHTRRDGDRVFPVRVFVAKHALLEHTVSAEMQKEKRTQKFHRDFKSKSASSQQQRFEIVRFRTQLAA